VSDGTVQRLIAFGGLGLLVEVFFTGVHSLIIKRDLRAPAKTYLWMFPIYGLGGALLEHVTALSSDYHLLIRSGLLTLFIFAMEFFWGGVLHFLLGRCPWKYTDPHNDHLIHKFSIMGLIRLDYAPYWFLLALLFDYSSGAIQAMINGASRL
jgi:hypothetical protein